MSQDVMLEKLWKIWGSLSSENKNKLICEAEKIIDLRGQPQSLKAVPALQESASPKG